VISLRKSVDELERLEELHKTGADCYRLALRCVAEYAVEVDANETSEFRRHLSNIEAQWQTAQSGDAMRSLQSSFRGELREHKDLAMSHLAKLRKELEARAKAMETFAASVTTNGEDHATQILRETSELQRLAETATLDQVRRGIRHLAAQLAASLEQMQRSNQMVIAQLADEIRLLHEQAATQQRGRFTDAESGARNREKIDEKIGDLLRARQPFCLLFLNIHNLQRLQARHSGAVVEGSLKALVKRLHSAAQDAFVGRWSEQAFVAILDLPSGGSIALARNVSNKLSGSYSVQENGLSHQILLEVTAGTIEHAAEEKAEAFSRKLGQLSSAVQSR
jgi:GGDEF domain-containing protein